MASQTGSFINSPTKGIKFYASPSGLSGTTDENGTYSFKDGDTVTFKIDLGSTELTLGSTSSPSTATSILSLAVPNGGNPLAVAQVLETLDKSAVSGKMDVSGISLPTGNSAIAAITNALASSSVSTANISTIATGVQTILTANNSGNLRYGTVGVSTATALTNLANNSANQSLLNTTVSSLNWDGSTVINIQDRSSFVLHNTWQNRNGSWGYYTDSRMMIIRGNGTYEFRSPYDSVISRVAQGSYTLSNGNRNGNWINPGAGSDNYGSFIMTAVDQSSFAFRYTQIDISNDGYMAGTFLKPLTLNDIRSKSFTLIRGCADGVADAILSFNSNAVASATCGNSINGTTWSASFLPNILQYIDANNRMHYVGITRISNNAGPGNLPSGSSIDVVNVYSSGDTLETYRSIHNISSARVN